MTGSGHQERFPAASLRDRCGFREGIFAGTRMERSRRASIVASKTAREDRASGKKTTMIKHKEGIIRPDPEVVAEVGSRQ